MRRRHCTDQLGENERIEISRCWLISENKFIGQNGRRELECWGLNEKS